LIIGGAAVWRWRCDDRGTRVWSARGDVGKLLVIIWPRALIGNDSTVFLCHKVDWQLIALLWKPQEVSAGR